MLKQPQQQDDILYLTAQELGLSKNLVNEVVTQFWSSLRHFLTNPDQCKTGILISGLGLFYIGEFKLTMMLKNMINKGASKLKIEYYKNLYRQILNKNYGKTEESESNFNV